VAALRPSSSPLDSPHPRHSRRRLYLRKPTRWELLYVGFLYVAFPLFGLLMAGRVLWWFEATWPTGVLASCCVGLRRPPVERAD
jgi:hypothetical protein